MTSRSRGPSDVNIALTSLLSSYDAYLSGSGNVYDVWRPVGYYLTSTTTLTLNDPLDVSTVIRLIAERYGGLISHYGSIWADVTVDVTIGGKSEDYDVDEVDLALLQGATAATIRISRSDVPPWKIYEFLGLPPMPDDQKEALIQRSEDVVKGWVLDHYRLLHTIILSLGFLDVRQAMVAQGVIGCRYLEVWGRATFTNAITEMIKGAPVNPWRHGG